MGATRRALSSSTRGGSRRSRDERAAEHRGVLVPQPPGERPRIARLLAGSDAERVLARLTDGDPLGLFARAAVRVRHAAYLLDPARVQLRCAARIALLARTLPAGDCEAWLVERVDEACRALVAEDLERDRLGGVPCDDEAGEHAFVAELLGLDLALARAAAASFNSLPDAERRAFFALAIEGRSVEQCLAEGLGPPEMLRARVRAACEALALVPGHLSNGARVR